MWDKIGWTCIILGGFAIVFGLINFVGAKGDKTKELYADTEYKIGMLAFISGIIIKIWT